MGWRRGSFVVFAAVGLFALAGGLAAAALDIVVPGYYPGVFPAAHMNGHASGTGLLEGISQGAGVGLAVGFGVVAYCWLLGEAEWRVPLRWCLVISAIGLLGGIAGGVIGWAVGTGAPEHYDALAVRYDKITRGSKGEFSPGDVGLGLGAAQGILLGTAAGVVLMVATGCWRYRRTRRYT